MPACSVMSNSLWPYDCKLTGSSVHGILKAKILESVAIHPSGGSSWLRDQTRVSCISYISDGFFTHWTPWEVPCICMSIVILKNTNWFASWGHLYDIYHLYNWHFFGRWSCLISVSLNSLFADLSVAVPYLLFRLLYYVGAWKPHN